MTAVKKRSSLIKKDLDVTKLDYDVDPDHKIAIIGDGVYANYLIKKLLEEGVNVSDFLTTSEVKGDLEGITVINFSDNRDLSRHIRYLSNNETDYFLTAFYNKKISPSIVNICYEEMLNLPASPLPFFRGPNPIEDMTEKELITGGVTIHILDQEYDTGDILGQTTFELSRCVTRDYKTAVEEGAKLFADVLKRINKIEPVPQSVMYDGIIRNLKSPQKYLKFLQ